MRKMAAMGHTSPTIYSEDLALLEGIEKVGDQPSSSEHMSTALQFRMARKCLVNDLLVAFGKRKRAAMKIWTK